MVQTPKTSKMLAVEARFKGEKLEQLLPRLYAEHNNDHEAVARALRVHPNTLYAWRREYCSFQIVSKGDNHGAAS